MSGKIPESHQDLIERPIVATLVTVMPDGQPQATAVWFDCDGENFRVNTKKGRQKERNLSKREMATLMILDPQDPYHYMELRGHVVEATEEGGIEHLNALSDWYEGKPDFYADAPARRNERRIIYTIKIETVHAR